MVRFTAKHGVDAQQDVTSAQAAVLPATPAPEAAAPPAEAAAPTAEAAAQPPAARERRVRLVTSEQPLRAAARVRAPLERARPSMFTIPEAAQAAADPAPAAEATEAADPHAGFDSIWAAMSHQVRSPCSAEGTPAACWSATWVQLCPRPGFCLHTAAAAAPMSMARH